MSDLPPKLWWSPSTRSFYCLFDAEVRFRGTCEPGHEMYTGLDPVPDDAVELTASQPTPTVAPEDTAAVLAGLVEEMREFIGGDRSWGIYDAIALVEAAQQKAATEADSCGDVLPGEFGGPDNVCTKPAGAHEWHQQGDGVRWNASGSWGPTGARAAGGEVSDEVIERCAEAARKAKIRPWHDWSDIEEDDRERWRDVARAVLAAAPPTPSAPCVAELLAEARRRQESKAFGFRAVMDCDEIVRLLAPGGADGEGT